MARKKASPAPTWASDPQYQAFEADLTAHPDDDTPRLVLADWLEEHGDEHAAARAEFIRAQIELAGIDRSDPRYEGLHQRQEALLAAHEEHWLGPLAKIVTGAVWRRGFPQRMKLGVRAFMDNADEIFRQAPILHLQLLRISQTKMTMEELAACPHFARLRGFSLPGSGVGDNKLRVLLEKADLAGVETLDLSASGAGEASVKAIASGRMPKLTHLNLSGNPLESAVRHLFRDDVPFALTNLELGVAGMGEPDVEALFGWRGLASVESLDLYTNRLGNAGARHLAASPYVGQLRTLNLGGCEIGMRGAAAVAGSEALAGLREINLGYNSIPPSGLEALREATFVGNLRALRLSGNRFGDAGMVQLAPWPGLQRIATLELDSNLLTAAGVQSLCSSPHLGELQTLSLNYNEIGDEGAVALAGCRGLSNLRRLDLAFCYLNDPGVAALLDSPHLQGLTKLDLEHNRHGRELGRRWTARFFPSGKRK